MATLKTDITTVIVPYIFYRDVPAALEWLAKAFGFVETMRETLPSGGVHGEMTFDRAPIMMGQGAKEKGMASVRDAGRRPRACSLLSPTSMVITPGRAPRGPRSRSRPRTCLTGTAIRRAISKGIRGSSPRLPGRG